MDATTTVKQGIGGWMNKAVRKRRQMEVLAAPAIERSLLIGRWPMLWASDMKLLCAAIASQSESKEDR